MAIEKLNDSEFQTYLHSNEKVVVKFMADWCGSCKLFAPKYKRIAGEEKYKDIKFIKVNAEENENARRLSGVDNLPFIAIFKSGKKVEGRATAKEEKLIELIETHLL